MSTPDVTADRFLKELKRVVNYFRDEWDLSYVAAIGALDVVKHDLLEEVLESESENDEEMEDA